MHDRGSGVDFLTFQGDEIHGWPLSKKMVNISKYQIRIDQLGKKVFINTLVLEDLGKTKMEFYIVKYEESISEL